MAGRKEFRKSITFRLNLDREEERELYETIRQHSRHVKGDLYGSAGAYIKTALRDYQRKKKDVRLREQFQSDMEKYLQKLAVSEREEFLKALEEHDKRLASVMLELLMPLMGSGSGPENTGMDGIAKRKFRQENIPDDRKGSITDDSDGMISDDGEGAVTEGMPEEALSYVLGCEDLSKDHKKLCKHECYYESVHR